MDSKPLFIRQLLRYANAIIPVVLLAACQSTVKTTVEPTRPAPSATLLPSTTATGTPHPTDTPAPTETPIPSETLTSTPSPTREPVATISETLIERLLDPCDFKLRPIDAEYPNPQANLDPLTGMTWMAITVDTGVLQAEDVFRYYWDTRAFRGDLSFNKGDGLCEVVLETSQLICRDIPLRGTNNLPTGGYEYSISIFIQKEGCVSARSYLQRGLIFMDTLEHDVFIVNDEDVP